MAYIGKTPIVGNFQRCDAITVVNGQAAYTLQVSSTNVVPESANHMLVSLNGILQAPVTSFTVSGATLTFASNLATGDVIDFVILLGNVLDLGTPSDGTVTNAKLAQDIISGETALASTPADTDEFLVSDAGTLKRIDYSLIKGGTMAPVFKVTMDGGSQALAVDTNVKVDFETEIFDPSSTYDTTNKRWTPGEAGYVFLTTTVKMNITNDFDYWRLAIYKNGSVLLNYQQPNTQKNSNTLNTIDLADADDYYEVFVYQSHGSGEQMSATATDFVFAGFKLIT